MKIKQLGLFALLFAQAGFAQDSDEKLMAKAKKIHEKVITIDTHNDINVNNFTHDHNYTEDLDTQVNLPKMDEGDLDVDKHGTAIHTDACGTPVDRGRGWRRCNQLIDGRLRHRSGRGLVQRKIRWTKHRN